VLDIYVLKTLEKTMGFLDDAIEAANKAVKEVQEKIN